MLVNSSGCGLHQTGLLGPLPRSRAVVVNAYKGRPTLPKRLRPRQRRSQPQPRVPKHALLTRQDSSELFCKDDNAFRDSISNNHDAHVVKLGDRLDALADKIGYQLDAHVVEIGDMLDAHVDTIRDMFDAHQSRLDADSKFKRVVIVTTAAFVVVVYTADRWLPGLLELIRAVR